MPLGDERLWKKWLVGLTLLTLLVFLGWNDVLNLRAEEPRRALVAMEMAVRFIKSAQQMMSEVYNGEEAAIQAVAEVIATRERAEGRSNHTVE